MTSLWIPTKTWRILLKLLVIEEKLCPKLVQDFLASLGTEPSRQASVLLRGRVACVDVTEARDANTDQQRTAAACKHMQAQRTACKDSWEGVQHLLGRSSALVCTSLLTQARSKQAKELKLEVNATWQTCAACKGWIQGTFHLDRRATRCHPAP